MRWTLRYQWTQNSSWFELFVPIIIDPQSSNHKMRASKSRIFVEEAKVDATHTINQSPSKSKIILPPLSKSIKHDEECVDDNSYVNIKVLPLGSVTNKFNKISESKKSLAESNSKTSLPVILPVMFQKS
jgi:hypothetical protein